MIGSFHGALGRAAGSLGPASASTVNRRRLAINQPTAHKPVEMLVVWTCRKRGRGVWEQVYIKGEKQIITNNLSNGNEE